MSTPPHGLEARVGWVLNQLWLLKLGLLTGLYLFHVRDTDPEGVLPRRYGLQVLEDGGETRGPGWASPPALFSCDTPGLSPPLAASSTGGDTTTASPVDRVATSPPSRAAPLPTSMRPGQSQRWRPR